MIGIENETFESVEAFYRRFYFRPRKVVAMVGGMLRDPGVMRRRLREGVEFFRSLRERRASRRTRQNSVPSGAGA